MTFAQLKGIIGKGDVFRSQDVQTGTKFGDYRVDGGIMTATGFSEAAPEYYTPVCPGFP